jgi:hypothetical protein
MIPGYAFDGSYPLGSTTLYCTVRPLTFFVFSSTSPLAGRATSVTADITATADKSCGTKAFIRRTPLQEHR